MILPMNSGFRFVLLLPIAALLGCALPPSSNPSPPLTGSWENWQIQAGSAITSPPTGLYFTGAVQTSGTQSAAVFTTVLGIPTPSTLTQVLNFLGTYNSATGAVDLLPAASGPYLAAISFTQPSTNTVVPVGVIGGCVYPLNYQGPECLAITSISAVGTSIAPLNGTYTGTLTDSTTPSLSGAGSLTLTQSTTPDSSGAFALTGTITFPTLGTFPLTGTVSGEGIALNYCSAAVIGPCIALSGSTNPAATQITVTNLTFSETVSGPPPTFTGTLNN
jgi:hypothetical protein